MTRALYPLSADPFTNGHLDIIERASKIFDELWVGVGKNPDKKYLFELEDRLKMLKKGVSHLPNVKVVYYKGLLVDYAWEQNIQIIIRGMRDDSDFKSEEALFKISSSQNLGIEFAYLFGSQEKLHISSTGVKSLIKEQGLIHEHVPLFVKQTLEEKILGQYIISVTGEVAMGKSFVCEKLVKLGKNHGIQVHNIDLDVIGHQITSSLQEPRYEIIRSKIVDTFGKKVEKKNGEIDRKALGKIVFKDREALRTLDQILYEPLLVRLRREMYGKQGILLLNGALIVEADLSAFSNNNVILVKADKKTQIYRMRKRGLSMEQITNRANSQFNTKLKKEFLLKTIKNDDWGQLWEIKNEDDAEKEILKLFKEVRKFFEIFEI